MEEVKKKSPKWIILGIITLIVIIGIIVTFFIISNNKKVEELNVNTLKYMKCLSNCPYEPYLDEDFTRPVKECFDSCKKGYLTPNTEELKKYSDKLILNDFSPCVSNIREEEKFSSCINNKLQEYSDIADLSNIDLQPTYEVIETNIENLICEEDRAKIDVKLTKGKIEEIKFVFEGEGSSLTIEKQEIPSEGETKSYEVIYSQEGISFNVTRVRLAVSRENTVFLKDIENC